MIISKDQEVLGGDAIEGTPNHYFHSLPTTDQVNSGGSSTGQMEILRREKVMVLQGYYKQVAQSDQEYKDQFMEEHFNQE